MLSHGGSLAKYLAIVTSVERVARYDRGIGGLAWAAPQDMMREDAIIYGGRVSPTVGKDHRPRVQHDDLVSS